MVQSVWTPRGSASVKLINVCVHDQSRYFIMTPAAVRFKVGSLIPVNDSPGHGLNGSNMHVTLNWSFSFYSHTLLAAQIK